MVGAPAPAPAPAYEVMNPNTTLMVVSVTESNKTVVLDSNPSFPDATDTRILYIKGTSGTPVVYSFDIACSNGATFYPSFTSKTGIQPYSCVTLFESPANTYQILSYYTGSFTDYVTGPDPGTTIVNTSGNTSMLFIDLRTQSKVLVLPTIASLSSDNLQSPYFMIKDVYGNAYTNNLFLSTSGVGETFEGLGTTLRFTNNFTSMEIAGDPGLKRWHILSWQ